MRFSLRFYICVLASLAIWSCAEAARRGRKICRDRIPGHRPRIVRRAGAAILLAFAIAVTTSSAVIAMPIYHTFSMEDSGTTVSFSAQPASVAEPSSLVLFGAALIVLGAAPMGWRLIRRLSLSDPSVMKRILDVSASFILLAVTFPVLLLAAVAIRVDSKGPIFYWQERVGRAGKRFLICKLRTMRVDAEQSGMPQWAAIDDQRVTRVGRFLRRMRIDELPQILNVLKGEMSLVGPRPERPFFVESLARELPHYGERHLAKPGITGWAQVNYPYGASVEDARRKLSFDLHYVGNIGILFDLWILLSTPKAVFVARGGR
jgi:lipopolysaccharide/colanic/teichoic acid biosynthesis glycosyltransferase